MNLLTKLAMGFGLTLLSVLAYAQECRDLNKVTFEHKIVSDQEPKDISEASDLLSKALTPYLKDNLAENNGVFTVCGPFTIENYLDKILYEYWHLDDWNKPITRDLVKLGLYNEKDMVGGILSLVADKQKGIKFNFNRVRQAISLSRGDAHNIDQPIPASCSSGLKQNIRAINLSINGYSRVISYVNCGSGEDLFYLWERGWFLPDAGLMTAICKSGVGDLPSTCEHN